MTGIVWDNLGDRLPDVEVVLLNDALNFRRSMSTTIDGVFSATGLVPSTTYRLTVNRKGFTGVETKEFHIPVGQVVALQFNLAPKPPAEQVTLPSELPPTDHSFNPGAAAITPRQLEQLPTRGPPLGHALAARAGRHHRSQAPYHRHPRRVALQYTTY